MLRVLQVSTSLHANTERLNLFPVSILSLEQACVLSVLHA